MSYQRVVVGIGNPGPEYDLTRHNVGFMALDRLAARFGRSFARLERKGPDGVKRFSGKVKARVSDLDVDGTKVLLVEPQTYVNLSGQAVGPILRSLELTPDSLFVVVDDLNLPQGRIRVRPSGSSGGHNGLKSISDVLATDEYPRLRLGIGRPQGGDHDDVVDYVLDRFHPEEMEVMGRVLDRCCDIVLEWCRGTDVPTLMGDHNGFRADDPTSPDSL
jgi:PTH1 family peptidyl-tRNA hydrolase